MPEIVALLTLGDLVEFAAKYNLPATTVMMCPDGDYDSEARYVAMRATLDGEVTLRIGRNQAAWEYVS